MEYMRLGRTGLQVSRLCLGTMNFGPQTTEQDAYAIMDRALELGINFFDSANVYGWKLGEGVTEQIVGRWWKQGDGRREKVVLATKVFGKMGDWPNQSRLSAVHIKRACEDSLRRLQTDYIDMYQMHHIDRDTPWDEIIENIIDWGHTRIPVYGTSRDEIVGILYSKDLLPELAKSADQPRRPLAELLRKPLFVPETKPVDDLLNFFQKSRTHIAVALDEFGGVSGLVTIEDVLEEIVGEIEDEDEPEPQAAEVEIVSEVDGAYIAALAFPPDMSTIARDLVSHFLSEHRR